ncbi:MAG: acyl-CoA dehydrogenase family protein [Pirellulales bacterium]|nr:acyl-CoA dehydrogenase family protein [Pirellulales bacterium]
MATIASPSVGSHFLFTEEHELLRKTVRQFLEREVNPHADAWEEAGIIPKSLYLRGGELGFFGHHTPEEYGGYGADARMAVVLAEEFSFAHTSGLGMAFGAHSEIAMPHIVRFGTHEQKQRWLPDLVAGRKVAALGITEPGAGSNVAGLATTARREGDHFRLTGSKIFITNSVNADVFCIAAKTDPNAGHKGISMLLVPRETPGFTVEHMKNKLGRRASDTGLLTFDECVVPAENVLGELNRGFYQIMQCFENERLVIAAGCVGAAQSTLERTIKYCQERPMGFGHLSDMQVTRQRLARSYMELEAMRQMVYSTTWRVINGQPSLKEVCAAKAFASEAACRIIDDCFQLHGGYAYFTDYLVERAYRDIRLDRIGGGATEVMLEIIAKQLRI